ncbi:cobyrinate a,c-diamide synthase [Acidovorax carolinensis]|uniref:cobyrinate a,c-diamide synthase n=1 Tax=Acidovorax carolinensis TaxID=553814 RepID=UPI000B349592|nr:cobyrinate a,c-diamide synthase [Acidovorax carolinensis]ART50077.1 cobyrinic acid a,c-diamide synthase [Acidovorax carolinensis]
MSASASARCPALLIAAPASGQGKTTVTAALARLHVRRGLEVRVFKCGPDFLDPHWHQLASGAPVHQLDLWMTGQADCVRRLHAAAQEADLILIEGVMGLFDGDPSAADLARRFGVPVLGVVDASAMAGTFGALAFGLQHYRPGLPWAGVLANRVGSARHAGMLQAGLREPQDWLGALMRVSSGTDMGTARTAGALLPERHLGLVAAHELRDSQQRLDAAADALAATPLGQMTAQDLQRWAVDFPAPAHTDAVPGLLAGRTVAVARDAAFCFIYTANVQCLTQMGARVVFFSPLHDAALPECDAVWLPGGYPELHTAPIAANTGMQASLRAHVAAGKPLWAECGGMMALFESITLADGSMAPLWGLLPGRVTMQKRLAALGPQQLDVAGHTLRGHTFHYSTSDSSATVVARTTRPDEAPAPDSGEVLYQQGSIHASYFHAWFPSSPEAVAHLLGAVPV